MMSRKEYYAAQRRYRTMRMWAVLIASVFIIGAAVWSIQEAGEAGKGKPPDKPAQPAAGAGADNAGTEAGNDAGADAGPAAGDPAGGNADPESGEGAGSSSDTGGPARGSEPSQEHRPGDDDSVDATVTLAFAGDVMFGGNVALLMEQYGGYDQAFAHAAEWLQAPDVAIANLEAPITNRGEAQDNAWVFRTSPEALPALKRSGIDAFSLANNHILDYGLEGLKDTIASLSAHEFRFAGAGMNEKEAFAPAILDVRGVRIALLGFSSVIPDESWIAAASTPGIAAAQDTEAAEAAVAAAAEQTDLVVVMVHWGQDRTPNPNAQQRETARRYIDAGADLVIGTHPQVVQGLERYEGKWIVYSLGSLVSTTNPDYPETWQSMILYAACSRNGDCELNVVPVNNYQAQPKILEASETEEFYRRLTDRSPNARINENGRVTARQ
jgi:poly-gamma-glutamate synthesis protein (capsule biosynthesis protein)